MDLAGYNPETQAGECYYDAEAGQLAVDFIEGFCVHVQGQKAGTPFLLEEWQADIVRCLFGWKRPDGTRRYRQAYIEVPRKNGKSSLLAAIICYMMFCPSVVEPGSQMYSAGADRDQASLVYDIVAAMIEKCEQMEARSKIRRSVKRINFRDSFYRAIPADAAGSHGYNAHFIAADELHAWPNREFWDVLNTSTGARTEPLTVAITTAGYDRNSICWLQHLYAEKVRDGIIDDESFLPVLFSTSPDDDWTDPKVWEKANPNLGVSVFTDYLARECKRAQDSPTYENTFRRLHLNQWTEQDVRWLQMDAWDKCAGQIIAEPFEECYAGLDLSATTDLTALVLAIPGTDHSVRLKSYFWVPEEKARERERRDRVPYATWSKQGHLTMTRGNVVDYDEVRRDINRIAEDHNLRKIGVDRWNATQLVTNLTDDGIECEGFGQGFASMSGPTKALERIMLEGKLTHDGNPVLRWCASNTSVETDAAGNLKPSKKKSTERIDGIVASIMAVGMALDAQQATTGPLLVY